MAECVYCYFHVYTASHSKEDAEKLGEVSERLTKIKYNF